VSTLHNVGTHGSYHKILILLQISPKIITDFT